MEMGYTNSNLTSGSLYGKVLYQLADTAGPALRGGSAQEQSNDISHKLLQKVQRENEIKTETFTKLVAYTGSLSVKVTNSSNAALQGAQVQAYQNSSPVGAAAVTDASGTALLIGLAAGKYTVRATYFSISDDSSEVTVEINQTTQVPPIELNVVGGKAKIHVLDNAGAGVGGATVTAEAASGLHGAADKSFFDRIFGVKTAYAASGFKVTAVTDVSGIATFTNLPTGDYKFTVSYSGKEMKSLAVSVPDGSTRDATVVLPASGGNIVAMIRDSVSQAAIDGASVELKSGSTIIETKTTGSDGTVIFSGLTAGSTYTVTASADNYTSENTSTTVTDKETVAAAIALTPQAGGANITVKDDSNAPVKGATVSVEGNSQIPAVNTDDNGVAAFANLPAGTYTFTATKADYNSNTASATITGGSIAAVDVTLTRQTGGATITVTDGDNPISGITVRVTVNGQVKTETTNAQGEAKFISIPIGEYTFTATSGFASDTAVVTIAAGAMAEKTIALPAMGGVYFNVHNGSGPVAGAKISVTVNGNPIDKNSGADGKATFANLPVGDYTFVVTSTGYESKSQSVTIERNITKNVDLAINKIITAQINVKDSVTGYGVYNASVRITGNGIDETETTSGTGTVEFTVPAGDYTFTVTCNEYTSYSENISISDANKSVDLNLVHKVGNVTFSVKDRKGQPLSGVNISLASPVVVSGTTDANGQCTLNGVPTTAITHVHYFRISKDDYYERLDHGVAVEEGPNEKEILLKSTEGKARVTVKSSGNPLQGVTVTLLDDGSSKSTSMFGSAIFDKIWSGEMTFTASMTGYTTKTVTATIAPGVETPVAIELTPQDP